VVYPPTGSTAYEREMSTPPTLLWNMALLYHRATVQLPWWSFQSLSTV